MTHLYKLFRYDPFYNPFYPSARGIVVPFVRRRLRRRRRTHSFGYYTNMV